MDRSFSIHSQKGQTLLIVIMILATVVTVVVTMAFRSTLDTQITQLEQDSQKTLAAAEAGIEKAISEGLDPGSTFLFSDLNISNLSGIDISASQVTVGTNTGTSFITPLLQKDQQYTLYLSDYDSIAGTFSNPYSGNMTLYYGSESNCSSLALEVTVISGDGPYTTTRYIADTDLLLSSSTGNIGSASTTTVDGTSFNCRTDPISVPASAKLMIVRTLFTRTKVGVVGTASLRPQGRYVMSEATSTEGIVKKVQLFQSNPQIPAEFFVTSF